jgi:hypothetical protein
VKRQQLLIPPAYAGYNSALKRDEQENESGATTVIKEMMRLGMAAAVLTIPLQAYSGPIEPTCDLPGYACIVGNKGTAWRSGAAPGQNPLSGAASAGPGLIPPPAFNEFSPAYSHLVQAKGGPSVPVLYGNCGGQAGGVSCSGTAALDEVASVPAPATLALMVLGLVGLLTQRRSGR